MPPDVMPSYRFPGIPEEERTSVDVLPWVETAAAVPGMSPTGSL
ncbi:hypothetical protein [Wenjunlia tyrosinilytica]|nr:hypothetical protein [Wenjunlia tyrosinilytica]